jgi:hypothetical protein
MVGSQEKRPENRDFLGEVLSVIDPKTLQSTQAMNDACASNQVFSTNHSSPLTPATGGWLKTPHNSALLGPGVTPETSTFGGIWGEQSVSGQKSPGAFFRDVTLRS